ncbi:tetratricopeptide repeat protein [Halalkalibacter urbisdiaboli]|uniref:tetratricopeptide repeat protein n=1 Tax=Halalkalibacter urbisdiaboli TaxID=1960589 RepID=UPI000B445747|nr:tetratricopeptide repeat protein [Halalkalibacter urbisdiaboli]
MSDKRERKKETNVVLYPGLVKRLIEKGMDALKNKEAENAYQYFISAQEHEPNNSQVRFGVVLSLVELGRLKEAVELTRALLNEGIGDYYDNLQVHISLLVQLGYYQEVVDILDAVLAENRIPAQFAESFYQMLHFSRQMVDDNELLENIEVEHEPIHEDAIKLLQSSSMHLQWKGIEDLKNSNHPDAIRAMITYIENNKHDPLLRSIALQGLHKKEITSPVIIEKFGQKKEVIPKQLEEIYEITFGQEINRVLSANLEHENPILYDLANQLCWTHLTILYPFLPQPSDPNLWAAVFQLIASERLGYEDHEEEIADLYQCSFKLLLEKSQEVVEAEKNVFRGFDFTNVIK